MAIALPTIETVILHEGAPDYGVNDAILGEYLSKNKPFTANTSQLVKAKTALAWAFKTKGFERYEDQEVADFLFDTWVHSKVIYFVLTAYLTENEASTANILHTLKSPDSVYLSINAHCKNTEDKENFLAMCKFYRRRLERCYPRWINNKNKETLFKVFDKRVASFPYTLQCEPSHLQMMQSKAVEMGVWVAQYGGAKGNITDFVQKSMLYNIDLVQTGIWGIADFAVIENCKNPNTVKKVENEDMTKPILYGLGFLALTKLLKLW